MINRWSSRKRGERKSKVAATKNVEHQAMEDHGSDIAFFDVETTIPGRSCTSYALLEFGAILVCPRRLVEVGSYSTLIRPPDLAAISTASVRCNGITKNAVASAPPFLDVADSVFNVLHGRLWAGHNIVRFDCVRIREAFAEIGWPAPEPKGIIDTLPLLTQRFGRRAGDMKMASLATYFGLGKQRHRSLDDVRMNLEVLKYCSAVLFLESSFPDVFSSDSSNVYAGFLDPDQVLPHHIKAPSALPHRSSCRMNNTPINLEQYKKEFSKVIEVENVNAKGKRKRRQTSVMCKVENVNAKEKRKRRQTSVMCEVANVNAKGKQKKRQTSVKGKPKKRQTSVMCEVENVNAKGKQKKRQTSVKGKYKKRQTSVMCEVENVNAKGKHKSRQTSVMWQCYELGERTIDGNPCYKCKTYVS